MAVNFISIGDLDSENIQELHSNVISESITQNWTEQALECYRLNCDCANCSISNGNYSFACQMPKVLDVLMKNLGAPEAKSGLKLIK